MVCATSRPGTPAQGLWVEEKVDPHATRFFYNIAAKPSTAPQNLKGKQIDPKETYRLSSLVEVMPLVIHPTDDPAMWAIAVDQWRRMSFLTHSKDMTLLPLPLELAYKMSEYAELLRFYFPLVARTRYADVLAELEAQTGWQVRLHQTTHQQALIEMARRLLPSDLTCDGVPSLYLDQQRVMVHYVGQAAPEAVQEAQQQF